jgi:hypothetical protein
MGFELFFEGCANIPPVRNFERRWGNIPDVTVRRYMAQEHQFLIFHEKLCGGLRSRPNRSGGRSKEAKPLDLTLRAGFVKAGILICASICEAALRAHAERRGYHGLKKEHQRTFGTVLEAWKPHKQEIIQIWDDLQRLKELRNNVHLFKAARDPNADFRNLNKEEERLRRRTKEVLDALMAIMSP